MTEKAESPPTNGNEMKVLRRTLWIWPNGASVLGGAFITDERDINGILMIPNRHQDVRNRRFLVPSAGIVLRTAVLECRPFQAARRHLALSERKTLVLVCFHHIASFKIGPVAMCRLSRLFHRRIGP